MSSLLVDNLSVSWPSGELALQSITFEAHPGTITALVGPSGAGKSTLLRVIAGLRVPTSGTITGISGQPIMVFQEDSLWPHLTLLDNVTLPLRVVGQFPPSQARERAKALLCNWGLEKRLDAYPAQLSGGQRQRGALARAIVMEPRVLCLDEITSGLDPETAAGILEKLLSLKATETIVLLATHELNFARASADRALFIEAGSIVEQGSAAKVLFEPHSKRLREFLGAFDFVSRVSA